MLHHPSIPNKPLLTESLYLARYIEKAGSGTQMMFELCQEAGLPAPEFEQRRGTFVVTIWRDWLTDEILVRYDLNDRQLKAISYIKKEGKIANSEYQKLTGVAKRTSHRDLSDLVTKGLLIKIGTRGKGTFYQLQRKGP